MILLETFTDRDGFNYAMKVGEKYGTPDEQQNEDLHHCILRERGDEMHSASKMKIPVIIHIVEEKIYQVMGEGLSRTSNIVDILDLNDQVLEREYAYTNEKAANSKLERLLGMIGGVSLHNDGTTGESEKEDTTIPYNIFITRKEEEIISDWPKYLTKEVCERKIFLKKIHSSEQLESFFDNAGFNDGDHTLPYPVFIKTRDKCDHHIIRGKGDLGHMRLRIHNYHDFFISEYIDIANDERGKREFRIYMVDGKPVNISRTGQDYIRGDLPENILDFSQSVGDKHRSILSGHYVLDVAEQKNGRLTIVELNGIRKSGRYFGNNFSEILAAFQDIKQ